MIYLNQTIILYTLNLASAVSQLYPNKTGRKKNSENKNMWISKKQI